MKTRVAPIRFLLPTIAVFITVAWFSKFRPQPKLDFEDIVIEAIHLVAVVAGYFYVIRLRLTALEIGWSMFVCAILIDFLVSCPHRYSFR